MRVTGRDACDPRVTHRSMGDFDDFNHLVFEGSSVTYSTHGLAVSRALACSSTCAYAPQLTRTRRITSTLPRPS